MHPQMRGHPPTPILLLTLTLALLSCSCVWAMAPVDDITCSQSGMCSTGKSKYYYGTVRTSEGFKEALESVSYKKELILVTTAGSQYLEFLYQLHNQFKRLGMSHFLSLSMKEDGCKEVDAIANGQQIISCGWDDSPQHARSWGGGPLLWHLRWRFIAQASRIGYNIMSLDSDYMILQDPYVFLKSPPMANATLLGVAEHACGLNGGFLYIQNARPDGPASWVYHRTTEVPLRWMDDDMKFLTAFGKQKATDSMCLTFDQSILDDSLHSTLAGTMISRNMFSSCTTDEWRGPSGLNKQDIDAKQGALFSCQGAFTSPGDRYTPPATWPKEPELKTDASYYRHGPLRVPNNGANPYPAELGGPHFDPSGGKYSDAYFEQLKNDCPDCPPWKDSKPEDAEAAANNKETLGFVPKWFAASASDLAHGFLTPLDGSRPRQVMFHFHVLDFVRNEWKATVNKIYRGFDWKLSRHLHSDPELSKGLMPGPYVTGAAPQRVLTIHPSVDLSNTKDQVEFKRITAGLKQLAIMSNRTLVFSDMPCRTAWVHRDPDGVNACTDNKLLLQMQKEMMPYAGRLAPWDKEDLRKEYRIFSAFVADKGCLGPTKYASGMMGVEFEEWVTNDAPPGTKTTPEAKNTIFHGSVIAKGSLGESMVMLKESEVVAELTKFDSEPLLFVGRPVVVDTSSAAADGWLSKWNETLQECRGLYYTPYKIDKLGAAKPEEYAFGPIAPIVEGKVVLNGPTGGSASSASSTAPAVASTIVPGSGSGAAPAVDGSAAAGAGTSGGRSDSVGAGAGSTDTGSGGSSSTGGSSTDRSELNKYSVLLN